MIALPLPIRVEIYKFWPTSRGRGPDGRCRWSAKAVDSLLRCRLDARLERQVEKRKIGIAMRLD